MWEVFDPKDGVAIKRFDSEYDAKEFCEEQEAYGHFYDYAFEGEGF
jgi:hypothetical protein